MTQTLREALRMNLIDRYGERTRFEKFLNMIDSAMVEGTDVAFILDVHKGLDMPVPDDAEVDSLFGAWVDTVLALAEQHEVDASEFESYWKPIAELYSSALAIGTTQTDPVQEAGALLGVKFGNTKPEVPVLTTEQIDDSILAAAIAKHEAAGLKYTEAAYRAASHTPTKFEFMIESIMDEDTKAKLHMEYNRFAKGPDATRVGNDPESVERFADVKRTLDLPVDSYNVADTLRSINWTDSVMGAGYWKQIVERYDVVR